jgi:hypothetical protein
MFFLGQKRFVQRLFNIPLDEETGPYNEFEDVRSETYIGMWYYFLFNYRMLKMLRKKKEYLTDKSPKKDEALKVYREMIEMKYAFTAFPLYPIEWPKHYPNGYPFGYLQKLYGELYS